LLRDTVRRKKALTHPSAEDMPTRRRNRSIVVGQTNWTSPVRLLLLRIVRRLRSGLLEVDMGDKSEHGLRVPCIHSTRVEQDCG